MTDAALSLPAETADGYGTTRFNALRHGVLSRYTVLPWEDADEYEALLAALAAEHTPQGPTEEHLVEELAGILWRKRRLRLAEAATHRRGVVAPHPRRCSQPLRHYQFYDSAAASEHRLEYPISQQQ